VNFNSFDFLFFLFAFMCIWPAARHTPRSRWWVLTVSSFVFYGWWDWRFCFLLATNGLIDFVAAQRIVDRPAQRRGWLVASIAANLGTLAFFKYLNFGLAQLDTVLAVFGVQPLPVLHVILPVGISFYTFQSMSYTIDVYRGSLRPTRNLAHFFAYLAMFPQLVAGPIVRASDLLPQLENPGKFDAVARLDGLSLIAFGMFKKVVIADNVALAVNAAFDHHDAGAGALFWWVASGLFGIQIYCDFSGYSDIAIGIARWMGYRFPENFRHPYTAHGFRDFWGRWHISLSTWFRDYLYIPLGGNRVSPTRQHVNLWITMLVSGVWHGANWTFLVWGAIHAAYLSLERVTRWPSRLSAIPGGRALGILATYLLTIPAWTYFRAETVGQANAIVGTMATGSATSIPLSAILTPSAAFWGVAFLVYEAHHAIWPDRGAPFAKSHPSIRAPALALVLIACVLLRGPGGQFIYFQF